MEDGTSNNGTTAKEAWMLSEQDVMLLLQGRSSPQARADVATKVAATFSKQHLTQSEIQLAQDIIRAMVNDIAVEVRQALSENLKESDKLPREVAIRLANDVESVALPVLEYSTVLTDDDLVQIIAKASDAKHEAIARRETVPEKVADALVDHAGEKAISTLVSNKGASLSDQSITKVVDKFATSEGVQKGLVTRERLPVNVAERLVVLVADSLKDHLVAHHDLGTQTVTDIVLQSREKAIVTLVARGAESQDIEKLVAQMHQNGRLTPSLVLRALCMGDVTFFEAALAVMTNVPLVNARLLIHDAGRLGLKSIYEKSGMPLKFLPAVRVAMDVLKETEMDGGDHDRERFRSRVIERILTQYEDLGEDDLNYLLSKIGDMARPAPLAAASA